MLRRTPSLVVAACAAALVTTSCATFTNDGTAAKLGDAELSMDAVQAEVAELGAGAAENGNGEAARFVVGSWLAERTAADSGLVDRYAAGELGVTCVFAVYAGDVASAEAVVERVRGGEAWSAAVAELAPTADDGRQPCLPLGEFPEDAAAVLAALPPGGAPGVLSGPSGDAFAVRAQGIDEVDSADLLAAVAAVDPDAIAGMQALAEQAWVNPQIGAINDQLQVVPLG